MTLIKNSDLAGGGDTFIGDDHGGVPISMFLVDSPPGDGPKLHRHPYAEVFVVHEGEAEFVLDDSAVNATGGDVVIAPPQAPHKFTNVGEGRLLMTAIHTAPAMDTEWLEPR
jgi:quercetin dioxygenase-like cupin family protein